MNKMFCFKVRNFILNMCVFINVEWRFQTSAFRLIETKLVSSSSLSLSLSSSSSCWLLSPVLATLLDEGRVLTTALRATKQISCIVRRRKKIENKHFAPKKKKKKKKVSIFLTNGTTKATMSGQQSRKTLFLALSALFEFEEVASGGDVAAARCALCSLNIAINASSHAS